MKGINIYFDGGSKPTPITKFSQRWNGYGSFEIESEGGLNFKMEREQFGPMTCNQAEYTSLIKALEWLIPKIPTGVKPVINIFTDSKLLREQMMGAWKIKKAHLKESREKAIGLLNGYNWVIQWRGRIHNVRRFGH